MKRQNFADLAMTGAILLLGGSLVFSGVSLLRLRWSSIEAAQPMDLPELMGVGSAGAGIALLCWWILAISCALISAVAQQLGAARVAAFTGSCSPAFMRRIVIAVLGINLIAAQLAQAAPSAGTDPSWHPGTVSTAPAVPNASAPPEQGDTSQGSGQGIGGQNVLPPEAPEAVEPAWIPRSVATDPGVLVRPPVRTTPAEQAVAQESAPANTPRKDSQAGDAETDVVVKSGDNLWNIVAASLGPFSSDVDVALAWPRWYQANRETIGPDPNFILPGQVLHAPTGP
ncbi:hypothetical protein SAMN04489740_0152 [Arthrobacter alpinus]|uniref:LysM domain-containing protein n=1 Tax=Arthrobacter alpinus TaxID=656366 RepID=A0A1H5E5A3_9MICC|nr:hypothetical protein [Arthrobacter alpinus]SED86279.1 hypothetical protein SAMN04489740_0152 [Arthrobacter alpinus]